MQVCCGRVHWGNDVFLTPGICKVQTFSRPGICKVQTFIWKMNRIGHVVLYLYVVCYSEFGARHYRTCRQLRLMSVEIIFILSDTSSF
jgi:hypothetical protein